VTLHFPRRCHTDKRRYHNTRSSGGYCTVKLRARRIAELVQPSLPCQNIYPKKVKFSRYRLGLAQRVGIALLFHDRGNRRGEWSAARPGRTLHPGKSRYPLYRRLGGPQGRSGRAENFVPKGIRSRTLKPVVSHYID